MEAKAIRAIKIERRQDDDPDTSCLGEYTDVPSDWAICRHCGEYLALAGEEHRIPKGYREYRFFLPYAGGEKEGTTLYQEHGKRDYERMEALQRGDWSFLGIRTKAGIVVRGICQTVTSGGLWGIESDSGEDYLKTVEAEEMDRLHGIVLAFGFTEEEWQTALGEMEDNG